MTAPEDLAWLAGFWDGEGCVSISGRYRLITFSLGQAGDEAEELCAKVIRIIGSGTVNGPYVAAKRRKPYYMARCSGGPTVQGLLDRCRPWLSQTKIAQAERCLEEWRSFRVENNIGSFHLRTHCKNGHPFDEANTAWYRGYRRCKACHREIERRRRERLIVGDLRGPLSGECGPVTNEVRVDRDDDEVRDPPARREEPDADQVRRPERDQR